MVGVKILKWAFLILAVVCLAAIGIMYGYKAWLLGAFVMLGSLLWTSMQFLIEALGNKGWICAFMGRWKVMGFLILMVLIIAPIMCSIFLYDSTDIFYFNPKKNYEKWDNLNWLGVWCGTIALIIAFYPVVVCRGIYELFHWLFTVGRKK